jgi:uncharacterized OsmC-like protein
MSSEQIRSSIEAATKYLTEHPDEARYTDSAATATLVGGLRVRVDGPGGESITADMPKSVGGGGEAPSPGWLFRAALASCEATLIAMRAAAQGVELTLLEVTTDSESNDRGILGIDDAVSAGPLSIDVRVRIEATDIGADRLREIAEWGLRHCPVDDAARRAVPVRVEIETGG